MIRRLITRIAVAVILWRIARRRRRAESTALRYITIPPKARKL